MSRAGLTTTEAAAQLGVSVKTLGRWRAEEVDGAPKAPCLQPGGPRGPILWRAEQLEAWVEARSAWHRRAHLRLVQREQAPERQESLYRRAMKRAGRG